MQGYEIDITLLQTFGLRFDAGLDDVRDAYLRQTGQEKFQKVILDVEYLEKEFRKYYEAYATLSRQFEETGVSLDISHFSTQQIARILFNSGIYHLINHSYMKAGEKLEQAHKTNRDDLLTIIYLGILLMKRKNYYAAEKYFLQAGAVAPNNEDVWYYLAGNYFRAGNYKKALDTYEKVRSINPNRENLNLKINEVKVKLGLKGSSSPHKSIVEKITGLFKK